MNVGILGSGDVAKALAAGFLKHGHSVVMGTRDKAKLADWMAQQRGARASGFSEAAKFGEVVVLAVKGSWPLTRCAPLAQRIWPASRSSMRRTPSPMRLPLMGS